MTTLIEAIAYAIARGFARAWFDVMREGQIANEEAPTDADRDRADRMRDAVQRVRAQDAHDPRPVDPPPGG